MTSHMNNDSPMQSARMQCGALPTLPLFAAVSCIGNGNRRDRAFVRKECA
jgi:hypothetical protein